MVNSVTNTPVDKKVSYKVPLCSSTPAEVTPTVPEPKKPILKWKRTKDKSLQDHHNTLQSYNTTEEDTAQIYTKNEPFQDHQAKIQQKHSKNYSFQGHSSKVKCQSTHKHALQDPTAKGSKKQSFQDHDVSVEDEQDIISLKIAFPHLFDTTGNMPGVYSICLDPSVPPRSTCSLQGPHRMQRSYWKAPAGYGWSKNYSPSHRANGMGVILDIPQKARWFPPYLFRPKGLK